MSETRQVKVTLKPAPNVVVKVLTPAKVVVKTQAPIGIPEAPVNGYMYGRINRTWEVVEAGAEAGSANHLTLDFGHESLPAIMEIGLALGSKKVQETIVDILEPFNEDANLTITIGTAGAQALLMTGADNDPNNAMSYVISSNVLPDITDVFNAYFNYSNPVTQGRGQITLYFN